MSIRFAQFGLEMNSIIQIVNTLSEHVVNVVQIAIFLIVELIKGLKYLIVWNYELVSFFVRIFASVLYAIHCVFSGFYVALVDFVDQYSDLCLNVIKAVVFVVQFLVQCVLFVGHSIYQTAALIVGGLKFVFTFPFMIHDHIVRAEILIASIPSLLVGTLTDGFSYLATIVMDSVYGIIVWIRMTLDAVASVLGRRVINHQCLDNASRNTSIGMETCLALGICVISYLVYANGTAYYRCVRRKMIAYLRWLSRIDILIIETYYFTVWTYAVVINAIFSAIRYGTRIGGVLLNWPGWIRHRFQRAPQRLAPIGATPVRGAPLQRLPLNQRANTNQDTNRPTTSRNPTLQSSSHQPTNRNSITVDPERYLCVVCQDEEKSVMLEPCHHICMCRRCAEQVFQQQGKCPICRRHIYRLVDAYF